MDLYSDNVLDMLSNFLSDLSETELDSVKMCIADILTLTWMTTRKSTDRQCQKQLVVSGCLYI